MRNLFIRFSYASKETKISLYFRGREKGLRSRLSILTTCHLLSETALNGKVTARMNEEEKHFVRELIGISNNLNQLTKKGHQEGTLTAVMLFIGPRFAHKSRT